MDISKVAGELAPTGTLRAGVNLANPLLVTGKAANGDPQGISPDMSAEIARRLGASVLYVTYATPGEVADAAERNEWDIALIAADPKRAETMAFTRAYVEIEATYLVRSDSPVQSIADVDRPGTRIAVSDRSAYHLWLSRNIEHAELVPGEGLLGTFQMFRDDTGLDVLAGLRPALNGNASELPGSRILDGRYMTVQQAIGTRPGNAHGLEFLKAFVEEVTTSGFVAGLIDAHGVTGKLQVAQPSSGAVYHTLYVTVR